MNVYGISFGAVSGGVSYTIEADAHYEDKGVHVFYVRRNDGNGKSYYAICGLVNKINHPTVRIIGVVVRP